MPNTNKNASSDIANKLPQQVNADVTPVVNTAGSEQNKNIGRADQTFGTAQQGYQDFAKTGGFSPTDETRFLNRATQGVAGTYDVLQQQAERRRAAAGGLGTGGDIAQLARQGTQEQAKATEGAQVDLKTMENANKLAGLAGTAQLYNTATNQITAEGQQILQALGLKYQTNEEAAAILANLASQPGTFGKIIQTITALKPSRSQ